MKTVLVTGGTVRLGHAIATRLRAAGWRVLTSSHRPDAGADIVADLARADGADALFDAAVAACGGRPPDALVNNAGLFADEPARIRAVNLDSPCRLVARMAERTDSCGAVVNVLDCRVLEAEAAHPEGVAPAAYLAAKRALLDETRAAARRHAACLRVTAVAPGPVLAPTGVREAAGTTPLGRPTPADVADAVAFLLTAAATTGCVIPVDGGQSLAEASR